MVGSSKVVISTIQRVIKVLEGLEVMDTDDPGLDGHVPGQAVTVPDRPALAPEAFDLVIVDECHRSIYAVPAPAASCWLRTPMAQESPRTLTLTGALIFATVSYAGTSWSTGPLGWQR